MSTIPEWAKYLPVTTALPDAMLTVRTITQDGQTDHEFQWSGGVLLAVSLALFEYADRQLLQRRGRIVTMGPYRMEAIGVHPAAGWVLCRRLEGKRGG